MDLSGITDRLCRELKEMRFGPPVTHVYNPLEYARNAFNEYASRFGVSPRAVLLLGMNPGPWGMAQTGVPFGAVGIVREWLGITAPVGRPAIEHPARPVLGFDCQREEVSGARLWGWARDRFESPARFFDRFFVINYCPLVFMESSGRNRTPDRLPTGEREPVLAACDLALRQTVEYFGARTVIGVGRFAESRAEAALAGLDVTVARILHPSPANPSANKDWAGQVDLKLAKLGIETGRAAKRDGRRKRVGK